MKNRLNRAKTKPDKKPLLRAVRDSFNTRTFRAGGYSAVAALIVIAIAIAVNLFAGALPSSVTHIDTTASGLFTLSAQTEQLVSALDKDVTLYWIVQSGSEDSTISELLDRYAGLSSHITISKKDPVVYPNFASQYTSEPLYNNSLIVVSGERSQYISYTDIYVTDYSSYYMTGSVSSEFNGEGELTAAIDYVTNDDLPTLYTLSGHGESTLPSNLQSLAEAENMLVESLSLLTVDAVPENADLVVIYAPQSDISSDERDMLIAYLQGGGKMLMVLDYIEEDTPNLDAVLTEYGLTTAEGIVLEGDANHHMRGSNYYLLPNIESHTITDPLIDGGYYVLAPVAQGLTINEDTRDGLSITPLLETSSSAYAKIDGYSLTTYEKEEGDIDGPFVLGAAVSETVADGETQLVVFTSSQMFDETTSMLVAGANDDLFLNALDWLCARESAISIRAKSLDAEFLTVPSSWASTLSALLVIVLPLGFLIAGASITIIRRKR